jgi:hypothetical protein
MLKEFYSYDATESQKKTGRMTFREIQISWLFLSSPLLNKLTDTSILFASAGPGNNRTRRIRKRIVNSLKTALDNATVLLTEVYSNPFNIV